MITLDKQLFGAFVAEQRRRQGLTQQQLAQSLHVTDKAVSKWERGLSYPDVTLLQPLAEIFRLRVDDLLTCRSETLDTSPAHDTASPAVEAVLDISHTNDAQRRRQRRLLAAVIAVAVLVLAALSIAQRSGKLFLTRRTADPGGAFTLSVYRDGLLTGHYWLESTAPLRVNAHCSCCGQDTVHTSTRHSLARELTAVKSLRWSPDGRCLLLYGTSRNASLPDYLELWDFSAEPILRQEPTVGILVQLCGYEDPEHPAAPLLPALPGVSEYTYLPRVALSSPRWLNSGDLELTYSYTGTDGVHRTGTLTYDTAAGHVRSVTAP